MARSFLEVRRHARTILPKLGLIALGLLSGLALVEMTLRLAGKVPDDMKGMDWSPRIPLRHRKSGIPYVEFEPGNYEQIFYRCRRSECRPDMRVPWVVNSAGFRDSEHVLAKPKNVYRILCLGDSFTAGFGVQSDQSWPRRLESKMAAELGDGRVETINAGVPLYGTYDELQQFHQKGRRYRPDLVVVGLYLNDPFPTWSMDKPMPYLRPAVRMRFITSNVAPTRAYEQRLYAVRWLAAGLVQIRGRFITRRWYRALWSEKVNPLGYRQLLDALDGFRRLRKAGLPVVFLVFPKLDWLDDSYPFERIHRQIARLCRERDIPMLDLLPYLRNKPGTLLWSHSSDHHPSAWVHDTAAQALLEFLRKQPPKGFPSS